MKSLAGYDALFHVKSHPVEHLQHQHFCLLPRKIWKKGAGPKKRGQNIQQEQDRKREQNPAGAGAGPKKGSRSEKREQ
jgi:hypothetical protein